MNKIFLSLAMLLAPAMAGCSDMKTYPDYPWGDYPWESNHNHRVNPGQAWDDYHQYFGKDQPMPPGG